MLLSTTSGAVFLRRILQITNLFLTKPQFPSEIDLLDQTTALPPSRRIVNRAFAARKDHQVVDEGSEQHPKDAGDPGPPHPPGVVLSEQVAAPSGHHGYQSWAEVSRAVEASIRDR